MALLLRLRPASTASAAPLSIDLSGIVPERLCGLAAAEVARLPIRIDGHAAPLEDAFAMSGDCADGVIECRGDFSRVHQVGAGMSQGRIAVVGDVGRHAAAGMTGGVFAVAGNAGDWLAAGMTGGAVTVSGDVGDNAAGAVPGDQHGMQGGRVLVGGRAGALAGSRMRRGLLVVGGGCGAGAAFEMRAGTVVTTMVGRDAAVGMRRGSLVLLAPVLPGPPPAAGFSRGCRWTPAFLPLLARSLPRESTWETVAARLSSGPWQQWHGDPIADNRGEILCPPDGAPPPAPSARRP